jgi:hypothetical protein
MALLWFAAFALLSEGESEPGPKNPLLAVLVGVGFLILVAGAIYWRVKGVVDKWRRLNRTIALSVPFNEEQGFYNKLTTVLRRHGLRQEAITGNPLLFEPNAFRKFGGLKPVSVEMSGKGAATIVGPAAVLRTLKLQLPGAEERPYSSEPPRVLGPFLKVFAAAFVFLAITMGGIILYVYLQS